MNLVESARRSRLRAGGLMKVSRRRALAAWKQARRLADQAVRAGLGADARLERARIALELASPQALRRALDDCGRAMRDSGRLAEAALLRGKIRLALQSQGGSARLDPKDLEAARADFEEAIGADAKLALAYAWRAETAYAAGRPPSTEDLRDLETAAALAPDDAWIWGRLGLFRFNRGLEAEALPAFDRALALNPRLDWAWGFRSEIRRRRGERAGSLEDLRRALRLMKGDNPLPQLWMARRELEEGRYAAAALRLGRLRRRRQGDYPVSLRLLEVAHRERSRYREGVACLNALAAQDPSLAEWRVDHADLADLSFGEIEPMLERHPGYAAAWAWRGRQRAGKGRPEEALVDYERAESLDPRLSWTYVWRAETRRRLGDRGGALADAEAALRLERRHVPALVLRAELRLEEGDVARSLESYDRALELRKVDGSLYMGRARAWLALGKRARAKDDVRAALALKR